jgi:hypothetical protein
MLKIEDMTTQNTKTLGDLVPGTIFITIDNRLGQVFNSVNTTQWAVTWLESCRCQLMTIRELQAVFAHPIKDGTRLIYKEPK